ncbi:MAG: hypothetical protein C3F07_19610 [Anaerolineales bacterium]|nr:hypothetical protein [Anaerolineae bacterium]PWB69448.1 MAG: hypothetical protein C3F07_19610 [Anaerolineales bacterium]
MRKVTVFISFVLTTFVLVMLYGVVKAYQSNEAMQAAQVAVQQDVVTSTPVPTDVPTSTPTIITPEEAAQLAVQVVGQDNLLSAETSTFNGLNAYLITFTNKDVVYVGLDGQILSVQVAPVVVSVAPQPKKDKNKNDNQGQVSNGGGEHEDDHNDEHDD